MPMTIDRRTLLSSLSSFGALAALEPALGAAMQSGTDTPPTDAQQATYDFWNSNIRDLGFAHVRSIDPGAAPRAMCIYYDKQHGFVTGSDIGDVGLPDKGDVSTIINVDHVRPSTKDAARFTNLDGGSLRIDLQQATPMPGLAERLAWTAIASFLPNNRQLPPLKEMSFDPGTTWGKLQSVILPEGGGRWTWNFFLQHRKSRWMQLFEQIRASQGLLMPIFGLGLPAIAITALSTVDKIVGELTKDANTEWLFQSSDTFLYATKQARDSFEGSKLRLRQGMYVIMPSDQVANFARQSSKLVVKDGLIVPANTSSLEVTEAALQTVPEVTYITVGVTAKARGAAV